MPCHFTTAAFRDLVLQFSRFLVFQNQFSLSWVAFVSISRMQECSARMARGRARAVYAPRAHMANADVGAHRAMGQHGRDQYRCIACGGAGICAPAPHANASLAPLLPGLRNRHGLPRETKIGATLLAHSPASSQVALPPPLSPHIAVLSVVSQPFHLATAEACALCHVPCAVCPVLCASVPCALCAGALP
jgi:hypothetical protein